LEAKVAQVKAKSGSKPSWLSHLTLSGHLLGVGAKFAYKCLMHLAKWVVKRVHHDCGYVAKQLVPLHGRSSGHHNSSGGGVNPTRLLAYGVVYLGLTLAVYSLVLGFIASLFGGWHWIYSTGMGLVHLFFIQWPLWAVDQSLHQPLVLLALFGVLYLTLVKYFKADLWSGLVLALLLFTAWLFRGMWLPVIPMAINFFQNTP